MGSRFLCRTISILLLALFLAPAGALAINKNAIISQEETAYNNVKASDIQAYLNATGSQLASYAIPESFEVYYPIGKGQWDKVEVRQEWQSNLELEKYYGKSVAELLADWAGTDRANRKPSSPGKMNPLIALATMDKESASVTGSYKNIIVTEKPITMSWLMGYGFNGKMDSCIKNGDCDINADGEFNDADKEYMRQRAIWYGGPGMQIVEGTAALKRWSTNPEASSTCEGGGWERLIVSGECLHLENSITHALYRYTPNFSGNELFLRLYDKIKGAFPFPAVAEPNESDNDTAEYTLDTYNTNFTITGYKAPNNKAVFSGNVLADTGTTNWELTFQPRVGKHMYSVDYQRSDGSVINHKYFYVNKRKVGDINNSGGVDIQDLSILATYWGHTDPPDPMTNLNPSVDNEVNILDLSNLAANFEK